MWNQLEIKVLEIELDKGLMEAEGGGIYFQESRTIIFLSHKYFVHLSEEVSPG